MAENKKSFVLYADLLSTVSELDDDEAGRLLKHILLYVNDKKPETNDKIVKIAFEPIKLQLKRDLEKWEEIKVKRSDAGKASADKKKQTPTKSTSVESVESISTKSTVTCNMLNDTVTVIDVKEPPITSMSIQSDKRNANHAYADENFVALCFQKGIKEKEKVYELLTKFLLHRAGTNVSECNSRDFRQHFMNWTTKGGHNHISTQITPITNEQPPHIPKADPKAIEAKYGRRI